MYIYVLDLALISWKLVFGTVFLIFTVKHPDILPYSDLGIQKGLLRWYTSTVSTGSPKKTKKKTDPKSEQEKLITEEAQSTSQPTHVHWTQLPPPHLPKGCSLTMNSMRARLAKPLKAGLYLTPKEMGQFIISLL